MYVNILCNLHREVLNIECKKEVTELFFSLQMFRKRIIPCEFVMSKSVGSMSLGFEKGLF